MIDYNNIIWYLICRSRSFFTNLFIFSSSAETISHICFSERSSSSRSRSSSRARVALISLFTTARDWRSERILPVTSLMHLVHECFQCLISRRSACFIDKPFICRKVARDIVYTRYPFSNRPTLAF